MDRSRRAVGARIERVERQCPPDRRQRIGPAARADGIDCEQEQDVGVAMAKRIGALVGSPRGADVEPAGKLGKAERELGLGEVGGKIDRLAGRGDGGIVQRLELVGLAIFAGDRGKRA